MGAKPKPVRPATARRRRRSGRRRRRAPQTSKTSSERAGSACAGWRLRERRVLSVGAELRRRGLLAELKEMQQSDSTQSGLRCGARAVTVAHPSPAAIAPADWVAVEVPAQCHTVASEPDAPAAFGTKAVVAPLPPPPLPPPPDHRWSLAAECHSLVFQFVVVMSGSGCAGPIVVAP